MHEWCRRNSRHRILLQWKFSHVPSQPAVVPSPSIYAKPRRTACHLIHGICLNHRETFFWQSTSYVRFITDTLSGEFFTLRIKVPQVQSQCREVQWDLSREVKNELGAQTPMRMSAGRPSTMNSFLPAEIPQISMAVQQRLQISEFQFDKFNTTSTFS